MSSNNPNSGVRGDGEQAASSTESASPVRIEAADNMKRAAAQLIEKYFYQLTDGCGRPDCTNENCASSTNFKFTLRTSNDAAVQAVELIKNKAPLCEVTSPTKMAKGEDPASASMESEHLGEGTSRGPITAERVSASLPIMSSPETPAAFAVPGQIKSATACATPKITPSGIAPSSSTASQKVAFLTQETLHDIIESCKADGDWSHLIRTIGSVFNNSPSLLASFRRQETKESKRSAGVDEDKDIDEKAAAGSPMDCSDPLEGTSSGATCSKLNHPVQELSLEDDEVAVDIESVRQAFSELFSIPECPFQAALMHAIRNLSRDIEMELRYHKAYDRDPNYLNIFLIIMEMPILQSPEFLEGASPAFLYAMGTLPIAAQARLVRIWSKYPKAKLKEFVDSLQQVITVRVVQAEGQSGYVMNDDKGVAGASRVLKMLYYASVNRGVMDPPELVEEEKQMNEAQEASLQQMYQGAEAKEKSQPREDPLAKELNINPLNCRKPLIPWEDFVNDSISENVEMEKDFTYFKSDESKFTFMHHSFLLTTAIKSLGMFFDNRIRMMNERRQSLFHTIVHGAPSMPYLRLRIRRDHIIDDALVALELIAMDNPQDLKKQLFVEFDGEQGIDEGGVSKEFFQLVVEELFNPDIGMFINCEDSRQFWFNPTSFENEGQFTLIGIVLGLAIYNNVILDIQFPMVVYRKLMGKKGTFADLKLSHPGLALGLQELLDYDKDDVEEVFMATFRIGTQDIFGTFCTHDLKENGDEIPVTSENKVEFVNLYADYLLNESIEKQFGAFRRGFQMVTDESPLRILFRPEEIELLVCGSKDFDFVALEDATEYDGGFTKDSNTVRTFWDVVQNDFDEDQRRRLLQFTTGSDRVPVGGLAKLKLIIARNGPDSDRLPTSHTCFNVLLLPDYATKEKLKERLVKAITHAKGFGML